MLWPEGRLWLIIFFKESSTRYFISHAFLNMLNWHFSHQVLGFMSLPLESGWNLVSREGMLCDLQGYIIKNLANSFYLLGILTHLGTQKYVVRRPSSHMTRICADIPAGSPSWSPSWHSAFTVRPNDPYKHSNLSCQISSAFRRTQLMLYEKELSYLHGAPITLQNCRQNNIIVFPILSFVMFCYAAMVNRTDNIS